MFVTIWLNITQHHGRHRELCKTFLQNFLRDCPLTSQENVFLYFLVTLRFYMMYIAQINRKVLEGQGWATPNENVLLCQKHTFYTRDRQHSDMLLEGRKWGWGRVEGPTGGKVGEWKRNCGVLHPFQEFKAGINALKAIRKHCRKETYLTWFYISFLKLTWLQIPFFM